MCNKEVALVIGGLKIEAYFDNGDEDFSLIPSFKYFSTKDTVSDPVIKVSVFGSKFYKLQKKCIRVKTNNGYVLIGKINCGYRFYILNVRESVTCVAECRNNFSECRCYLYGSKALKSMGLKTALLIIYIGASAYYNRLVIHSSTIKKDGLAYCFLGESGEGKSTQSALWTDNIEGCSILNDDMPILQLEDGKVKVWGSPWSGKTNYYFNDSAELCAMVMMSHGKFNKIKKVTGVMSFRDLYSSCSCINISKTSSSAVTKSIISVINRYPIYEMSCLPEAEAALMCYKTIETDYKDAKTRLQ